MVTAASVLQFYDATKDVTIQCGASNSGLGAVLMHDGHPIANASKALTTTEQNYAQTEKKCFTIAFACTKFDQYIYIYIYIYIIAKYIIAKPWLQYIQITKL